MAGQLTRGQQTQPARSNSFAFALISDTHLGRGGNDKAAEQMRLAVSEINASPASLVLCCGDLVNAGEVPANRKHYPTWVQIAGGFRSPWHAVPGNHDPIDVFTEHVRPQTDYVVDAPGGALV